MPTPTQTLMPCRAVDWEAMHPFPHVIRGGKHPQLAAHLAPTLKTGGLPYEGRPVNLTPRARLARLLRLQAAYALFATLHWTLAYRFMLEEQGLPIVGALAVAGVVYLTSSLFLLVLPRMESRQALRWGLTMRILAIVPYAVWPTQIGLMVGSVAFGLAMVLFWVPYNLMFFEHRERSNGAGLSATYAAIAPLVDVFAALVAGAVGAHFGYPTLFVLAIVVGLWPLAVSFRLTPQEPHTIALWERLARLKKLRTLMFLDGVNQGVLWPVIPLVTLTLIHGTFAYAGFFAGLGLMGAASALFLGAYSDRRAKRIAFVVPFAFLFAIANFMSIFAVSVLAWGLWRGLATLSSTLFDPFKNAVLLDQADNVRDLYISREFLLSTGRMVGVTVAGIAWWLGALRWALIVPAVASLAYPIIIIVKGMYPEERLVLRPVRMPWRQ